MTKFAPSPGDTIHTAGCQQFICEPKPHDLPPGYRGSTVYGRLAGKPGWQVWNDEGLPVKYDGSANPDSDLQITRITPKEQEMPIFTPKIGDYIITKDGDRYTCIEKPAQYLSVYAPGTIFGVMSIPGGTLHMVWDSQGRPDDGLGPIPDSVNAIASVEKSEKAPKNFNPQPWDSIETAGKGIWTCCTRQHLIDCYGLAKDVEHHDSIFGFRACVGENRLRPVEWMNWPAYTSGRKVGFGYEITAVSTAPCNRPAIRGRWNREALIAYVQGLPESFGIDKDGNIE